jgi:predicted GIY-YIG superfamily endonuclease
MDAAIYEIEVFRDGDWKIHAFFDDKELALLEARRMSEGGRYVAVRVIEDISDERGNSTHSHIVYRWSKVDDANRRAHQYEVDAQERAMEQEKAIKERRKRQKARLARKQRNRKPSLLASNSYLMIAVKGFGILVIFGALIYGINSLT